MISQMLCPHLSLIFFSVWRQRLKPREGTDSERPFSLQGWEDWSHVGVASWQQRVGRGREGLLIWWSTKCCWLCASPSLLFWGYLKVQICISHLETPLSELWISILHPSLPKAAQLLTSVAPNGKFSPSEFPIPCGLGILHHSGSRQKRDPSLPLLHSQHPKDFIFPSSLDSFSVSLQFLFTLKVALHQEDPIPLS